MNGGGGCQSCNFVAVGVFELGGTNKVKGSIDLFDARFGVWEFDAGLIDQTLTTLDRSIASVTQLL